MKKFIFLSICLVLIFITASCGPSVYTLAVEMRQPSNSGLDFGGKEIAVMYIDEEDTLSLVSKFNKAFAEGLSLAVTDMNSGDDQVYVYRLPENPSLNYADKDTLVSLLMHVNSDVIFLLDKMDLPISVQNERSGNVRSAAHIYDSMNKLDKVFYFGANTFVANGVNNKNVAKKGMMAGKEFATSFKPNWKLKNFPVLYYGSQKWEDATMLAYEYKWKEAMTLWMDCLETNNYLKRSCACYNISLACYMLGDYELALEWLDSSDADCKLSISDTHRENIMNEIKK